MPESTLSRRDFLRNSAIAAFVVGGRAACGSARRRRRMAAVRGGGAEAVTLTFVCDIDQRRPRCGARQVGQGFLGGQPRDHGPAPADRQRRLQHQDSDPLCRRHAAGHLPLSAGDHADRHRRRRRACTCNWTISSPPTSYDLSDFRPDAVNLYQWDDKTYALPRDYGNQNLFYNVNIFEEAGVEPPPADWEDKDFTFEVFLDMLQRLVKKDGDRVSQWGFLVNRGQRPWASWVYSNGGALVHKRRARRRHRFGHDRRDHRRGAAVPARSDVQVRGLAAPGPGIRTGRCPALLHRSRGDDAHQSFGSQPVPRHRRFRWDVGTIPIGKAERRGTGGGGTGWASGAATKHPQQAWEFLKYITTAQAQLDEVAVGATTPSRVSGGHLEGVPRPEQAARERQGPLPRRRNMSCATRCTSTGRRSRSASTTPIWTCCGAARKMPRPSAPRSRQEADPLFAQQRTNS